MVTMLSGINLDDIRKIYLSLPIASCLIDRRKNFVAANEKYAELMLTPLSSIVGNNMININPPAHIENVERDFMVFDAGGRVPEHEIVLRGENLLVSVNPFMRSGEVTASAISVTLQNITRRKKMETELVVAHQRVLQAKRRIAELAHTDALTNLPNRRSFDAAIKREINSFKKSKARFTLIMMDVDAFKAYNDIYGHPKGDRCLASVANVVSQIRDPGYFAARYGGEEFVIILPQTDIDEAMRWASDVREAIEAMRMDHRGNRTGVVTASFGVVTLSSASSEMDRETIRHKLLEATDAALYEAKSSGRNCVVKGHFPDQK